MGILWAWLGEKTENERERLKKFSAKCEKTRTREMKNDYDSSFGFVFKRHIFKCR
ncbi:MAG: hypothetical protein CM15mV112_020 [uncultured marine virus]|nr:MAG: hypothetical protein CM15mV112_020 [uncultured marine virus]